jgi:hypothetical protein
MNIFIFTSSWTTLIFERASIMMAWGPSCQQLGLLPHTYSQALLVPITLLFGFCPFVDCAMLLLFLI